MERTDFEAWNGREVARLLALVENQRRYYQDMVASLPVGLVVLSANRTVVSANRAFRQTFGLRIEDLRGKTIEQILPSDRLIEKIREMTVEGIPQPGLHAATRREAAAHLDSSSSQLGRRDGDGNAADGRRRQRCALGNGGGCRMFRASRTPRRRRAGRSVARGCRPAPVHGRQWRVEQMLGYPASHWLKSPAFFAQRIHKEDREAVLALYRTAVQHTREVNAEFRAVTASGETDLVP